MRLAFVVLLLANIALALGAWLWASRPNPDAALLSQQVNADKVRVVPPPPVRGACLEWGTFSEAELNGARRELVRMELAARATESRVPVLAQWWVYIPPLPSRMEVERRLEELTVQGVTDYYAEETPGPLQHAISLGIFRNESAAIAFERRLAERGVRGARLGRRELRVTQTAFVLRELDPRTTQDLAAMAQRFPGSELKPVECPG
jgi:hypothetical protein